MLERNEVIAGEGRVARLARKVAVALVSAALVVTLAGGFLHTRAGRPWMARIFGATCPMNDVTAAEVDAARRDVVTAARGAEVAPARPAFGFRLDESTVADVKAWAQEAGVRCRQDKAWLMKCSDVAPALLGRPPSEGSIEELALGFSAAGRLVNVTTLRRHLSPEQATLVMRDITSALSAELGPSRTRAAEIPVGAVSNEPLSSTTLSLHYSDYLADVTAINLPASGVAVREHYLSARD